MAVPTIVATATNTVGASTDDVTFTLSAAPAADDVIYVFDVLSTGAFTQQAVTGWTNGLGATDTRVITSDATVGAILMHHTVTGGEAGTTAWTINNLLTVNEAQDTLVVCLRGVNLSKIVDGVGSAEQATTGATHVLAGTNAATAGGTATTPTVNDGLVLRLIAKDGFGSYTTPAGHTQLLTLNTASGQAGCWLGIYTTATTGGVDVAATNITASAGDEFVSLTITAGGTGGTNLPVDEADEVDIVDSADVRLQNFTFVRNHHLRFE